MAESFPISGNIDPKSFPFLLMDLHHQGATGSLKVEGPAFPKALYYRSGRILFGSSNDPRDQLGSILIENGKITAEQLAEVNTKVGPGNPLAKVLSESGYVNQRELGEAARIKVERILSDIVGYPTGTFEFEDGVLPKGAVDLKLSTEKLVVAAVRRIQDRAFVLRHLDGLATVVSPRTDRAAELEALRPDIGEFSQALDGTRSVKEAAAAARIDEFDAAKIASALLFLGIVERGAAPATAPAAPLSVEPELDLAQTAAMAFGDDEPTAIMPPRGGEAEDPFFVSPEAATEAPFPLPEPEAPSIAADAEDPFATGTSFEASEPDPLTLPGAPAYQAPLEVEDPAPLPPADSTGFAFAPELETTAIPVLEAPAALGAEAASPTPSAPAFEASTFPAQPFDAEPEPAPTPSKPSREDLAALDALLNPAQTPRKIDTPAANPAPAGPSRSGRWEPQFQSLGKQARRPARRQTSPLLMVAAGVLAIAAIGGGSWYYLTVQAKPSVPVPATPAPTPLPTEVAVAPSPETTPLATPAADVSPTPAVVPTEAPVATPATPIPTPVPTPTPSQKRAAAPASPLDNGPVTNARSLMRGGSLGAAAKGFAVNVQAAGGSPFTIQLLVACSSETVQKALDSVTDDDLYILPVNYKGKDCHRVCWGLYDSEGRAGSAASRLPGYFRENGASPKVVRTATLLR